MKEKLKLVQNFLHVDAQDQLTSLEEKMKSSKISMVCDKIIIADPGVTFPP